MNFEYYYELNQSCFRRNAITVSKDSIECFIPDGKIQISETKKIIIKFNGKEYKNINFRYINREKKKGGPYFQLRWSSTFSEALSKEFIYSYINFMEENKNDIEQKEYMVFKRKNNSNTIILKPVIKIKTGYDKIFKKLFDVDFFGWESQSDKEHIITYNSPWYDKNELKKYSNEAYVIYYLIDEKNKEFYIGSTKKLGTRFTTERDEIPNWNKFRYDRIHHKYYFLLRRIEHHTIGVFKYLMKSKLPNSQIIHSDFTGYTLVNKNQYN